ncbi:hypothetical protein N7462_010048 [Penicillium macrosclerotiorum]|uniref:uncharacterized protein n=1 Tax=Penicillium macrosclerotiorum TaxID=303699 RepID=UPI0025496E43|nr:uncharacterized protein N7462_010048 [Penicillium macrosclerotiorum]KAJ5668978.1 hypothetical protein N7462_010048 [Penicillium macrosclerotiorum]
MKYLTTLTLALASVATADWALYCGDSCSNGALVASGSEYEGSCTSLGGTYDYCYILADSIYYVNWWKAIFFENESCLVNNDKDGYHESNGLFNGSCTDSGSWTHYKVVINA